MNRQIHYFNCSETVSVTALSKTLSSYLHLITPPDTEPVVLCIGTDRVTGDSLGPLVGYKLMRQCACHASVYGTLQQPIHALNMEKTMKTIKAKHPYSPIIAVDASLGRRSHIGCATISPTALSPGIGVEKKLGTVGDISITGIVCPDSSHAHLSLQTTRLELVMRMADFISEAIAAAM